MTALDNLDLGNLSPSTSPWPHFAAKVRYSGRAVFSEIEIKEVKLNEQAGMLQPISTLVFTFDVHLDRWPGLPDYVVTEVRDQTIWLPIAPARGYQLNTADERAAFEDKLQRGLDAVSGFFSFMEATLAPDPSAANRLAPLGRFTSRDPATGAVILNPMWYSLKGYTMGEHAPEGFPIVCSPSGGKYLNPRCVDRKAYAAQVLARAEAQRKAAAAEAQRYVDAGGDSDSDMTGVMGQGNEDFTDPASPPLPPADHDDHIPY